MKSKHPRTLYLNQDDILLVEAVLCYNIKIVADGQHVVFKTPKMLLKARLFEDWLADFVKRFGRATNNARVSAATIELKELDQAYLISLLTLFAEPEHMIRAATQRAQLIVQSGYDLSALTAIILKNYQARSSTQMLLLQKIKGEC